MTTCEQCKLAQTPDPYLCVLCIDKPTPSAEIQNFIKFNEVLK